MNRILREYLWDNIKKIIICVFGILEKGRIEYMFEEMMVENLKNSMKIINL